MVHFGGAINRVLCNWSTDSGLNKATPTKYDARDDGFALCFRLEFDPYQLVVFPVTLALLW